MRRRVSWHLRLPLRICAGISLSLPLRLPLPLPLRLPLSLPLRLPLPLRVSIRSGGRAPLCPRAVWTDLPGAGRTDARPATTVSTSLTGGLHAERRPRHAQHRRRRPLLRAGRWRIGRCDERAENRQPNTRDYAIGSETVAIGEARGHSSSGARRRCV